MQILDTLTQTALPQKSACVALGLFDGLHLGHRAVLEATLSAAAEQDLAPVCFTFTTRRHAPAAKAGTTRLLSDTMAFARLEQMGFSAVIRPDFDEFRDLTPQEFVHKVVAGRLGAALAVCGYDFHFGRGAAGAPEDLSAYCGALGVQTQIVPALLQGGEPVSSSRIRALIAEGDIPAANALLGRPFAIDFEVIHGRRIGRTLGSPTINQPFPADFTLPPFGVYASVSRLDGQIFSSVTNVGVKPTVGSDDVLAETYIQGFDGDLYGRRVQVEFLAFLRPEQKFDSLDALRAQIGRDAADADKVAGKYLA